jgi:hypothetical protein
LRRHPGTSARGHFAGTPTRSLHARGAGAPGRYFGMSEVGGVGRRAGHFTVCRRAACTSALARKDPRDMQSTAYQVVCGVQEYAECATPPPREKPHTSF